MPRLVWGFLCQAVKDNSEDHTKIIDNQFCVSANGTTMSLSRLTLFNPLLRLTLAIHEWPEGYTAEK